VLFEKDIDLPAGFEVRSLDPNHADQMIELLLHAQDGDADQAAIRIAELPSVGIFEKATDKLVAFEYNDGIGSIAHQYVYPEYRGRGFGKAVEILLSRKNVTELGIRPAKCVAISRPKVQAITSKAGYWTKLTNAKGEPAHVWWTIYSKTPKTPIQIFDN
uniref:FR47-like domain-containing protein n=1 Tax=Panagrolaimus sp. JU765 TaxID=591449 RepID=A0AC34R6E6_9BILA